MNPARSAVAALASIAVAAACGPSRPCATRAMQLTVRRAGPYVGRWTVVHGDTLTLPQMGDRFKLAQVDLDSARVETGTRCRLRGALVFTTPRVDTFPVTWLATPEQAFVYGWPADLGPFGGLGVARMGDSLRGALLFDSRLGVNVRPGLTAQFVARRAPPR